jgi:putative oxidoreductase
MTVKSLPSPQLVVPALGGLYEKASPLGEPLVRFVAGLFLLPHGMQKLFGWFGGYGLDGTSQFFVSKLGLPASFATLAALIEVFGGLALAVGLFTRVAAAFVFVMMAVAVVQVHLGAGFFWTGGGWEYPAMWGLVALSFVVRGGGRLSVDSLIGREI